MACSSRGMGFDHRPFLLYVHATSTRVMYRAAKLCEVAHLAMVDLIVSLVASTHPFNPLPRPGHPALPRSTSATFRLSFRLFSVKKKGVHILRAQGKLGPSSFVRVLAGPQPLQLGRRHHLAGPGESPGWLWEPHFRAAMVPLPNVWRSGG